VPKTKTVLKRIRQNEKRRLRNRANVSRYKTAVKKLEVAIEANEPYAAKELLPSVVATIDKAVSKNALTKNSAARKKSSLARRVNALG
jgi:small subunit ribosomal protein S20